MKTKVLFLISFLALSIISCEKDDSVSTSSLEGKYTLKTVDLKTQFTGEAEDKSVEDVSSQGMYYNFEANGNYTTNAFWAIGEINKDTKVNSGTYSIKGEVLTIKDIDADLGKELNQKMQIKTNKELLKVLLIAQNNIHA